MKKHVLVIILCSLISGYCYCQRMDSAGATQQQIDSLKKWEISVSINTPEPLSIAGFDYNALTQRIFINGDRKEYTVDAGLSCSRKLRYSLWLNLAVNYAYYYAYEKRDSRLYIPTTPDYFLDTLEIQQKSWEILTGGFKRYPFLGIQFDVGGQLRCKLFSKVHGITTYNIYDGSFFQRVIYDQTEPGGVAFGLSPFVRIGYRISRNIFVTARFSSFVSYYQTGGDISTYKTIIVSSGINETGLSISRQTFEGVRFFPVCVSLQMSYSIF